MKPLTLILILIIFATGCPSKRKALETVRAADELAAKLLIYGRNIAKANNDSFEAGNIPASVHKATNEAAKKYLAGVDVFLEGIATAKKAIADGKTPDIDLLETIFNQHVVAFATDLISKVVTLPDNVQGWAAALSLAISSFRALFAGVKMEVSNATA